FRPRKRAAAGKVTIACIIIHKSHNHASRLGALPIKCPLRSLLWAGGVSAHKSSDPNVCSAGCLRWGMVRWGVSSPGPTESGFTLGRPTVLMAFACENVSTDFAGRVSFQNLIDALLTPSFPA